METSYQRPAKLCSVCEYAFAHWDEILGGKYESDYSFLIDSRGEWGTDGSDGSEEHSGNETENEPVGRESEQDGEGGGGDEAEGEKRARDMGSAVRGDGDGEKFPDEHHDATSISDVESLDNKSDLISEGISCHSYGAPFHRFLNDWIVAAENGCTVCSNLVDQMKTASLEFRQSMQDDRDKWPSEKLRGFMKQYLVMQVTAFENIGHDKTWIKFQFTLYMYSKDEIYSAVLELKEEPQILVSKCEPSTGSNGSLLLAKTWIERCQNEHSECSAVAPNFKAPTRLLELSDGHVRLRNADELEAAPAYATLSHCWGALDVLKLKQDTLRSFKDTIPIDNLCKTFRDAITVTQAVGLKYLWVDSLCIIQDSPSDWFEESSQMSEVYGNSTANIAATHASDGSHGLFASRPISTVSRRYAATNTGKTYEFSDHDFHCASPVETYKRCLTKAPLTGRAWAFQERYLARRTLHFTSEQIFFECRHHVACETWQCGNADFTHFDISFPRQLDLRAWPRIVEHYSRGQLTFAKDKFVALSGVARQFAARRGDEYFAGLWGTALERSLCWMVVRPENQAIGEQVEEKKRGAYIAPAWSWASASHPISYNLWSFSGLRGNLDKEHDKLMKVIDTDVRYLGMDSFGQVQDATLTVKCGPMISASVMDVLTERYDIPKDGYGFSEKSYAVPNENGNLIIQGYGYIVYDQGETTDFDSKYFLPVLRDGNVQGDNKNKDIKKVNSVTGIIVTAARGKAKGWLKRIGVWDIIFNVTYEDMIGMLRQDGELMREDMYSEVLERNEKEIKQYTAILV